MFPWQPLLAGYWSAVLFSHRPLLHLFEHSLQLTRLCACTRSGLDVADCLLCLLITQTQTHMLGHMKKHCFQEELFLYAGNEMRLLLSIIEVNGCLNSFGCQLLRPRSLTEHKASFCKSQPFEEKQTAKHKKVRMFGLHFPGVICV